MDLGLLEKRTDLDDDIIFAHPKIIPSPFKLSSASIPGYLKFIFVIKGVRKCLFCYVIIFAQKITQAPYKAPGLLEVTS
jgi:hypothetical protein